MSETTDATNKPRQRRRSRVFLVPAIVAALILIALGVAWKGGALRRTPKLVLVTSTENPYWDRVIVGAQVAAKQVGAELTVVNKGDAQQQLQSVREAVDAGASGIAVSPIDPNTQTAALADAARKVPLVTIDSDCPGSNRVAFVGTDNYFAGRQCGRLVREAIPDGGKVILCVGSVTTNGQERRRGVIDILLDRPRDPNRVADPIEGELKGDKYTVAATLLDGVDRAKATALAADAIAKHPDVKCFVGLFGYNTPAVIEALSRAGKLGQVQLVGFEDEEATVAGIEAGHVYGSVVQDQYNMGFDSVMCLWGAARGTPTQSTGGESKYLPAQEFTHENVLDLKFVREREAKAQPQPATAPTQ